MNLNDVARGGTICLSRAVMATGGTTTLVKFTAPNGAGVDYAIKGYLYHKGEADDLFTPSGVQASGTVCLWIFCLNSAGTCSVVKGTEVSSAAYEAGSVVLHWPVPTDGTCVIGAMKLVTTAIFTGGTTAIGTGNTATYYNLLTIPVEPLNYSID